jgi:hypothetical protein
MLGRGVIWAHVENGVAAVEVVNGGAIGTYRFQR